MLRLIKNELLAPEDSGSGAAPIESTALNQAGMEELLMVDDEETKEDEPEVLDLKPEKKPKEETDEVEETDDKDEEEEKEEELEDDLEEDLKEPDEEDLELVTPVRRKEILAKYPNLFKEFPYLEKAYYREQKYTELFPTINEAESAAEKAGTWDKFETELAEGNLSNILSALNESDKNTFYKVADTILDTIQEIDPGVATHIYSGVAKQIIELMVSAGSKEGQEGLKTAAHLVHQFLFGARDWEEHKPLHKAQPKDPRVDEVAKRERALVEKQFTAARDEIGNKINNSIKATIERNIDPKESMTAYVKDKAVEDVLKDVQEQMKADKRFQKIVTKLWENALRKDFNEESKTAIRSAVMAKAKQLLLPAIKKGRNKALGATGRKSEREVVRPEKTGPDKKLGKSTSPMNRGNSDKEKARAIPAGMSTKDWLMQD